MVQVHPVSSGGGRGLHGVRVVVPPVHAITDGDSNDPLAEGVLMFKKGTIIMIEYDTLVGVQTATYKCQVDIQDFVPLIRQFLPEYYAGEGKDTAECNKGIVSLYAGAFLAWCVRGGIITDISASIGYVDLDDVASGV